MGGRQIMCTGALALAVALTGACQAGDKGQPAQIFGVQPPPAQCDSRTGGSIVVALAEDLPTLNPANNSELAASSIQVYPLIFDRFFRPSADVKRIEPQLATSADPNADFTEWTIKLRPGVVFQDGGAFTAEDAAFSLQSALDGVNGYALGPVDKISVVEPLTVRVTMKSPYAPFVSEGLASSLAGWILPKDLRGQTPEAFFARPITTGAFKVTSYSATTGLKLEANKSYWADPPKIDSVDVRFVGDVSQRLLGLQNRDFDYADQMTANQIKQLPPNVIGRALPAAATVVLFLYPTGILEDPNVRKALSLAIDRKQIADVAYMGMADPAKTVTPSLLPGVNPIEPNPYVQNLDEAKKLMAKSRFPQGGPLDLSYIQGDENLQKAVSLLQSQLSAIGIEVKTSPLGTAAYTDLTQSRKLQAALFNNTLVSPAPYDFVSALLSGGTGWDGIYPTDTVSRLVTDMDKSNEEGADPKLLNQMEQHHADIAAHVPVVSPKTLSAQSERLANLVIEALNEPRFNDAWLCDA